MRRVRVAIMLACSALVATMTAAHAAHPYPPPSQGSATVTPSRIRAGECAVFAGDGFMPLSSVAVGDNGTSRGSTRADASGTFSQQLCFAADAKRGRHTLTGTGTGSDANPLTVSAVLIVEGVRQSATATQAQPLANTDGPGPQPVIGGPQPIIGGPQPITGGPKPVTGGPQPIALGPTPPKAGDNSGLKLLLMSFTGVGVGLLASLGLLRLSRSRRRAAVSTDSSVDTLFD